MPWITAFIALSLALIHLFASRLKQLAVVPRSRWLSAAGGIAVAYVFIHILPDLAERQKVLGDLATRSFGFLQHHVYLLALVGMMLFYGLERLAKRSRQRNQRQAGQDVTQPGVFTLHIASFALYNALIGYLLVHREIPGLTSLLLFSLAMATHFLVNDFGLHRDHKHRYDRYGRWLLAGAVLAGWGIGALTEIHAAAIAALFAFLAGGVILNVLKEELPRESESRFWAFAAGALAYTALLLTI